MTCRKDEALAELEALEADVARAVLAVLDICEAGLADARAGRIEDVERRLNEVMAACAVSDLAGQRARKVRALLEGAFDDGASRGEAGLLNGPATGGQGLSQTQADDLFD